MEEMINLTAEEYKKLIEKAAFADALKTENEKLKKSNEELNNENELLNNENELLNKTNNNLENEKAELKIKTETLQKAKKDLEEIVAWLKQLVNLRKAEKYLHKSEQKSYYQMSLFDELELLNNIDQVEKKIEENVPVEQTIKVEGYTRNKKNKGPNFINCMDESKFKKEIIHIKIDDPNYRDINSDEVTKILDYEPAQYVIKEYHRHKYETIIDGERVIVRAEGHENPLGKTTISPKMVAHIIYEKTVNAQPLFRQEREMNNLGIPITRQHMSSVLVDLCDLIMPVAEGIENHIINAEVIRSDETPLKVIKGIKKDNVAKTQNYIWALSTGKGFKPATIYKVGDRSRQTLIGIIGNNERYLQSDAYQAYLNCSNITNVLCLTHVRRKFMNCIKEAGKKGNTVASIFVEKIAKIYQEDNMITRNCDDYQLIKSKRLETIKPLFDDFFNCVHSYLENKDYTFTKLLENALKYAVENEQGIYNILLDGRLELDNNASERKIKDIVIGRKNWLFSFTEKGATTTCTYYSIMRTAIENGLDSERYLEFLFTEFGLKPIKDATPYLPWSDEMQKKFKI